MSCQLSHLELRSWCSCTVTILSTIMDYLCISFFQQNFWQTMLRGVQPVLMLALLFSAAFIQYANAVCSSGDSICHIISSQAACTEVTESPTSDCRWAAGLNTNVDEIILTGDIVAYQIKWFDTPPTTEGEWSNWFVTGVNDIDGKFNTAAQTCAVTYLANSMRRKWSYFYDHTHKFIICYNQ